MLHRISLAETDYFSEVLTASIIVFHQGDDEGSTYLRNVGKFQQNYQA
jgi:hypothetical protein